MQKGLKLVIDNVEFVFPNAILLAQNMTGTEQLWRAGKHFLLVFLEEPVDACFIPPELAIRIYIRSDIRAVRDDEAFPRGCFSWEYVGGLLSDLLGKL